MQPLSASLLFVEYLLGNQMGAFRKTVGVLCCKRDLHNFNGVVFCCFYVLAFLYVCLCVFLKIDVFYVHFISLLYRAGQVLIFYCGVIFVLVHSWQQNFHKVD